MAGELVVIDRDPETGNAAAHRLHQVRLGRLLDPPLASSTSKFETKAKFILAIETGGMFQRLNKPQVLEDGQLHPGRRWRGVPTRATRRFIRRLADEQEDPGLRLRRLRPVRHREHLPHAEGGLGQRGAHQPVLLRAAGAATWA